MIIVVDSDGLIGISNKDDTHHIEATHILQRLIKYQPDFIYPATTIAESTAILQIRLNRMDIANQILEVVKSGHLHISPVNDTILIRAASLIKRSNQKHATLFDGIVAAVAEKENADAIFSFDHFYKKKGFKLASEL